ncbi:MAG: molybdopterin-dependent oxidoreductase [Candidatus Alcyoniella australis]|nr:molybdopterin-dependent oxidoreductase [Candidatus Alcyoniella australis]
MGNPTKRYTLTIDGKQVEVPAGTTILEAARSAGVQIPTLCHHDRLDPIGSCRVCLVRVAGCDQPLTACDTPAESGMVVTTESDELTELRRQSVGYVLAHHPLDCPVCDKGGECLLQDLTYQLGISEPLFQVQGERGGDRIERGWPLIIRNDLRCIRCGRCVAICRQVQAVGALEFIGHGLEAHVDTVDGEPLNCEFCGQCLHVCPVGALLSKPFLHSARVWDLERTSTTCPYCGVGCKLFLDTRRKKIKRVFPDENGPNKGNLCVRGTFGWGFEHASERLATPLRRHGDHLRPLSDEQALDIAADALQQVLQNDGPSAVAALASARMTNEEIALLRCMMRDVIGSPHIDSLAALGYRQALEAVVEGLGTAHHARIGELEGHDAILVIGSDLAVEMPVASIELLHATRRLDAELMVLANRPTKLAKHGTFSRILKPGGEPAAALALIKWLVESGRFDERFVGENTIGFSHAKESLSRLKLDELLERSGLDHDHLAQVVNTLRHAQRPLIVIGPDLYEAPAGLAAVRGLVNLMLCCPLVDRDSRILLSADRCNLRGAAQIARPGENGLDANRIFEEAFKGQIKALLLFGVTPLANFPKRQRVLEALEKLDCLIVCDPFLTDAASRATVVIPSATFASKNGSYTAADGTLRPLRRAVPAPGRSLSDLEIIEELARRLDHGHIGPTIEDAQKELFSLPAYAGLDERSLAAGDFCPSAAKPEKYKQLEISIDPKDLIADHTGDLELIAAPLLFHNGTLSTHATKGPGLLAPEPRLRINPTDAQRLGLSAGVSLRVENSGGSIIAPLDLDAEVPPGTLLAPTHFKSLGLGSLITRGRTATVKVAPAD